MFTKKDRKQVRSKIKFRIRKKISGNASRPRVSVFRSLKHISAQAIDDTSGKVIAGVYSTEKSIKSEETSKSANLKTSSKVGEALAEKLKSKGINEVVFDRNGFLYHGLIKQLAESLRSSGIKL